MAAELPADGALADLDHLHLVVEMNEALMLGALRQHELTEEAEVLNAQLRVEIAARASTAADLAEKARLLDLTHDAIIVRDMVGHVCYWNRGAEELYGWSREEAMGEISHLLLRTEFPVPLAQVTEELHRTNRWAGELVHTTRAGQRLTVLARKTLDRDRDGQPAAVLENLTNITGRKQAEEALRKSEARFSAAVSIVSSLIWTNDAHGKMAGEQPGWGNFTGQTREDYQGYGWAQAVHPDDAQPTIVAWEQAVAEKRMFIFEHRLRRADGEWRLCSIRAVPLFGDGGAILEWVGVHTDITEQKRSEEILRRSEERYRALIMARSDVIYRMSADWSEMAQLDGRDFLADASQPSRTWLKEYIYPDDQAEVLAVIQEAIRTKSIFELEHRVRRVDGTVGWTRSKAVPLLGAQGEITEWFGAASDVTERKRTELNLAFLAAATQDLAQLTNVDEIIPAIAAKLAAHLQLSLCVFAEIHEAKDEVVVTHDWHRADVPGVIGTYRIEDFFTAEFQRAGRAGEIFVVRDTATDPRTTGESFSLLKVASLILVPLIRDGQWRFALALHHSEAWDWREDEIELARELAVRLWTRLERLRAEEARRISEERYRYLFETMDEGYCVIEMIFDAQERAVDYRFLEINPVFEKLTGLHDALGKTMREFVPDLEEYWFEIYGKVALTGEPVRVEHEAKTMHRWFDVNAVRIGGTESRKLAVFFNDITTRKKTEQELAEKARLLDLSHDAIIVRDNDGHIRYWNHGAEELYGWSRAEALGKISHHLLQTEFFIPVEQMTAELHRTGRWIGELRHTDRDGRHLTVLVRKTLDRDREGQPAGVLENITDITARKLAESALRASEAFNRSIIDSSPDCIKVLDLGGNLLSLESGQELLGIEDMGPFLNHSWIDFWEGEHRLAARAAVEAAAATGEGKFVGFFRTLRGEPKWWDVAISPIRDAAGQTERLLAVLRDVTERHELEDSLVARASDLVQADRSKDEFLAMLAHELRNPLAPLRNAAEILRTADVGAEAWALAQGILTRQIENMSQMIDDLLDVSRITEGKIELRQQVVALAEVLNAAANLARPGIEARGQELTITLPAEPVFLHADATRLDQVFGNLLTNACKYSASGCHISVNAERAAARGQEPPEVIVRVRDDGMGIAPELLPRIFDLFVQATRSLDRAHGGLGIGLTLVQRLVKLHGGSVEARSEGLGHGSEFIVRLPILPAAAAPTPPPVVPARDIPCRMLIVDDNEDSARSMATLQGLRGHTTRIAFTGPEAVAAAAEFLPTVVLLDIGLPGMDGYEVARELRAMPALAGAFLVAMSGYGSDADRTRARLAGFDEYLVKPADHDLLRIWMRARAH